jgi:hypothetical protein
VKRAGSVIAAEFRSQLASGRFDSSSAKLFRIVLTLLFASSCVSEIALAEGLEERSGDGDPQVVRGVVEVRVVGVADGIQELGPSSPGSVRLLVGVFVGAVPDPCLSRSVEEIQDTMSSGIGASWKCGGVCWGKEEERW